jgi:hypothetical protein
MNVKELTAAKERAFTIEQSWPLDRVSTQFVT